MPDTRKTNTTLILFAVLFTGFLLRIWGNDFGLPFFIHPDENKYLPQAMGLWERGELNPHFFKNPPLTSYIYALAMGLYYLYGKIAGRFPDMANFIIAYNTNNYMFFVMARTITALFGTATCFMTYLLGKKLWDKGTGLLAAAILSFTFLHVRDSHYAVNDIIVTFFIMLAIFFIIDCYRCGQLRDYKAGGFFCGLAIGTKFNSLPIIIPVIAAMFLGANTQNLSIKKRFLFAGMFCFLGFFLICPWVIFDPINFAKDFVLQLFVTKKTWFGTSPEIGYLQFIKTLLWGYGVFPLILALYGLLVLCHKKKEYVSFWLFPLLYFLMAGKSRMFFVRFTIPLLPFLALFTAYAIALLRTKASVYNRTLVKVIYPWLVVFIMAQGVIFSLRHDFLLTLTDTRIIARDWLVKNVPASSRIGNEWSGAHLNDLSTGESMNGYEVEKISWPCSAEKYRSQGFAYIVTNSFLRDAFSVEPAPYRAELQAYRSLDSEGTLVFAVDPVLAKDAHIPFFADDIYSPFWNLFLLDQPGPQIKIYKL